MLAPDEKKYYCKYAGILESSCNTQGFLHKCTKVSTRYTVLYRFNVNYTYFIHTLIYTVDGR